MPTGSPTPQRPPGDFARRCAIASGVGLGMLALFLVLWYATYVILLIFAGVLLGVLLRGLAELVSRGTRLPEGWALTAVIALLLLLLAGGSYVAYPAVSEGLGALSDQLPAAWAHFQAQLAQYPWGRMLLQRVSDAGSLIAATQPSRSGLNSGNLMWQMIDVVIAVIVIGFTAIYLAAEPRMYTNGLLLLVPPRRRRHAALILQSIAYTLRHWIAGQAVTMVVIGTLTGLGLWLIGIKLWLLLGVLAALFNFIPNFGPLVSFIPAILLAMVQSPTQAGLVLALYVCAQSFEGYLLTPLIQRRAVALPPAVTITMQVLMGVLAGPIGVMLAAPLTAAGMVAVKMLYVEDVLGDDVQTPALRASVAAGVRDMTAQVATGQGESTRQLEREQEQKRDEPPG